MKITVRIPDEWAARIEKLCEERGIPKSPRGCTGGRSLLLKSLLAEALGIDLGPDYHARVARRARILRRIKMDQAVQVDRSRLLRARLVACLTIEDLAKSTAVPERVFERAEKFGLVPKSVLEAIAVLTEHPADWFSLPWPAQVSPGLEGVPEWLVALRSEHQISQRALARLSGAHVTNIGRWERGLTEPSPQNLLRIRQAFPLATWPPDTK